MAGEDRVDRRHDAGTAVIAGGWLVGCHLEAGENETKLKKGEA